jgi:propionyl-CoA synthetase
MHEDVVLKAGIDREPHQVEAELVHLVRARIGAVASVKNAAVVGALPKTRSGKIPRMTMRSIADGHDAPIPSAVDHPGVVEALRPVLRRPGRTT